MRYICKTTFYLQFTYYNTAMCVLRIQCYRAVYLSKYTAQQCSSDAVGTVPWRSDRRCSRFGHGTDVVRGQWEACDGIGRRAETVCDEAVPCAT